MIIVYVTLERKYTFWVTKYAIKVENTWEIAENNEV